MTRRIFVAGHNGMVGRAIVRQLEAVGDCEIITRSRAELDLMSQRDVQMFFKDAGIDQVYLAAAKVGGIQANNNFPAEFIYENLMIEANIIHAAHLADVQKLLFLGSSCIYPKLAPQPMREDALLTGVLEPTNEPYAIAKIAGIKMCESYNRQYSRDYRSVMPTNLYGPGDNYHGQNSHVVPALIKRMHQAKVNRLSSVDIWGSGLARREFLYVDDMAGACLFVHNMNTDDYHSLVPDKISHINVGCGTDISILELAELVSEAVGFSGKLSLDITKPDGTPRKLLDTSLINKIGWNASTPLKSGLNLAYKDFLNRLSGNNEVHP